MANQNSVIGNSLIPIKGISQAQKKSLNTKCQIYDVNGLLSKGMTAQDRAQIAKKIGVDKKYVNMWVKQADLWRVMGMTPDYAYLLVLVGIRCVTDLAKADLTKTQQVLSSIALSHPGIDWDPNILVNLIMNASILEAPSLTDNYLVQKFQKVSESLPEELQEAFLKCVGMIAQIEEVDTDDTDDTDDSVVHEVSAIPSAVKAAYEGDRKRVATPKKTGNFKLRDEGANRSRRVGVSGTAARNIVGLKKRIKTVKRTNKVVTFDISEEPEPTYLFDDTSSNDKDLGKTESEIIEEGLGFLKDITVALPLPHIISGLVKIRSEANGDKARSSVSVSNLLVEIKGIVNPAADSTESNSAITTYTDGNGRFSLVMPDRYSLQDSIEFVFSYGGYKQSFIKQASEIIDNAILRNGGTDEDGNPLTAAKLIEYFDTLDWLNKEIKELERGIKLYHRIDRLKKEKEDYEKIELRTEEQEKAYQVVCDDLYESEKYKDDACLKKLSELEDDKAGKDIERSKYIEKIYGADPTTNEFEKTLMNLMSRTDLETRFDGDESDDKCNNKCFVIIEEVFKNYRDSKPRALPSVKLMGEGNSSTWLPTDTAPSRAYSYSMIQRLVEPSIYPPVGETMDSGRQQRQKMTSPVDVLGFKKKMMTNPDQVPRMASLGIGYSLNMHQAWVPDGFALGTLLYSLILAPGEEQRVIVREHDETYNIMDTGEASDYTSEATSRSQTDDIQALYDYALNQESIGSSSSQYEASTTSVGASASGGFMGFSMGVSASHSTSKGSASSNARQNNSHNEASQAAQSFNQQFSTASEMLAKSKRVSIRTASSAESDSVATKIIANHNHSHAMTVQYWEVVRRYRLETSIEGIDLILFVPLELIRFMPGADLDLRDFSSFNKTALIQRYETLIEYYTPLRKSLPFKYRAGLDLIQRYASLPTWVPENMDGGTVPLTISFDTNLMEFDVIQAYLYLKNDSRRIVGEVSYQAEAHLLPEYESKEDMRQAIRAIRSSYRSCKLTMTFRLPTGTLEEDINYISIEHSCETISRDLPEVEDLSDVIDRLDKITNWGWFKNRKIDRVNNIVENYVDPTVTLYEKELKTLGDVSLEPSTLSNNNLELFLSSDRFRNRTTINVYSKVRHLRYSEFQKMEATMHHIASETMLYSRKIWQSLSYNELAMMLEQYNIDMNFKTYFDTSSSDTYIPLLNCVNVKKVLGFYGNCILLPFTYPEELADKLGKTAAEIQDSLYRYHSSCFRAPSTCISIPTSGMIGEAVLGATNVSEEIDLTRFWNWKDSPIDSMTLDSSYLNGGDYLGNKTTKDFNALNLQTATQVSPTTANDIISALVAKQTPTFENITGQEQTASILNNAISTTASGRDNVINQSSNLASKAMEYATQKAKAESEERVAQINASGNNSNAGGNNNAGGGNNNVGGGGNQGGGGNPDVQTSPGGGDDEEVKPADPVITSPNPGSGVDEDPGSGIDEGDPGNTDIQGEKDSELVSIIDGAVDAIRVGISPDQFFTNLTGKNGSVAETIAEKFCSLLGSDLASVIKSIMNNN